MLSLINKYIYILLKEDLNTNNDKELDSKYFCLQEQTNFSIFDIFK